MASAHTTTDLTSDQECPICTEAYRDARVLECGHHFCRVCLEEIATGHPDGHVTCPTCRHITKTEGQTAVEILPKYRLVNDFVANVDTATQLMKEKSGERSRACDLCADVNQPATQFCFQCSMAMCSACSKTHSEAPPFQDHKLKRYSPFVFCETHKEKCNISFCSTCKKAACAVCTLTFHKEHDVEKLETVASRSRSNLEKMAKTMSDNCQEQETSTKVATLLRNTLMTKSQFTESIDGIITLVDDLRTKAVNLKEETLVKVDAEIKVLTMMNTDFTDFLDSKSKLQNHISFLLKNVSNQEIIHREAELPQYDPKLCSQFIQKKEIDIPEFSHLNDIVDHLKECTCMGLSYFKHSIESPLQNIQKCKSFNDGAQLCGLALDTNRKRLIARRNNDDEPLTIYEYNGSKISSIGKGIPFITSGFNCVAIDTKRDLILVPLEIGYILLLSLDGEVKDEIAVTDKGLQGICYSDEDVYLTTSDVDNTVYLINPSTKEVKCDFAPDTELAGPYHVACGELNMNGDTLAKAIFVSCYNNKCVKVLDYTGKLLHIYGTENTSGFGLGHLHSPGDICMGPGNKVLVTDIDNKRIMSFDRSGDAKFGYFLLSRKDIDNKYVHYVEYDQKEKQLFLGNIEGNIVRYDG